MSIKLGLFFSMTYYAFSALFNFFTGAILGGFVLYKNWKDRTNRAFFAFAMMVASWSLAYYFWQTAAEAGAALLWCRLLMAAAIFIPVTYLHFVFRLLNLQNRRRFLIFSYALFAGFLLLDLTPLFVNHVEPFRGFNFWPMAGATFGVFLVFWYSYVIYATYWLYRKFKVAEGIRRLQLKYVLVGMVFAFAGGSTNFFMWYRVAIPPVLNIMVSAYVGTIAYSIIRYRLMDIRIVARRILVYITLCLMLYSAFYVVVIMENRLFSGLFTQRALLVGIILASAAVPFFQWLSKQIERAANKYLFFTLYNYQETINGVSDRLTYYTDLNKISALITHTIESSMGVEHVAISLIDEGNKARVKDPLHKYLALTERPVVYEELDFLISDERLKYERATFRAVAKQMEAIGAAVCVPLISSGRLIGILSLGKKTVGDPFTVEDLGLLTALSNQASIAIDNARLLKKVRDFNKSLAAKVDEQTKDLSEKSRHLEELLHMKSDFLRVVNHQLNTPLSVMRGYFSMMDEGDYTPEKALPVIKMALERMTSTVADFWDAYELEGERMEMLPERVDLAGVIERLVAEKRNLPLAQERKLSLEIRAPEFELPIVWCDLKKITHAISNLLDNAVFYTRKGGVEVSYNLADSNFLQVNVRDTGMGITEQNRPKIFQKFSRGYGASSMHADGSGLGLYICKKIVEGNDGTISFTSEGEDRGTTFSFTVPIYKNQQPGVPVEIARRGEKIVIFN